MNPNIVALAAGSLLATTVLANAPAADDPPAPPVRQLTVSYDGFDTQAFWHAFSDVSQMQLRGDEVAVLKDRLQEQDWTNETESVRAAFEAARQNWKRTKERMDAHLRTEVAAARKDARLRLASKFFRMVSSAARFGAVMYHAAQAANWGTSAAPSGKTAPGTANKSGSMLKIVYDGKHYKVPVERLIAANLASRGVNDPAAVMQAPEMQQFIQDLDESAQAMPAIGCAGQLRACTELDEAETGEHRDESLFELSSRLTRDTFAADPGNWAEGEDAFTSGTPCGPDVPCTQDPGPLHDPMVHDTLAAPVTSGGPPQPIEPEPWMNRLENEAGFWEAVVWTSLVHTVGEVSNVYDARRLTTGRDPISGNPVSAEEKAFIAAIQGAGPIAKATNKALKAAKPVVKEFRRLMDTAIAYFPNDPARWKHLTVPHAVGHAFKHQDMIGKNGVPIDGITIEDAWLYKGKAAIWTTNDSGKYVLERTKDAVENMSRIPGKMIVGPITYQGAEHTGISILSENGVIMTWFVNTRHNPSDYVRRVLDEDVGMKLTGTNELVDVKALHEGERKLMEQIVQGTN